MKGLNKVVPYKNVCKVMAALYGIFLCGHAIGNELTTSKEQNNTQATFNEEPGGEEAAALNAAINAGYLVKFDDVFELALDSSKEYQALTREVESKTILKDKEEKYYYPRASINSETTKFYGTPVPSPDETQDFIFKLDSKIYGSAVSDKIAASREILEAGNISLRAQEINVYYTVLRYLTKIELTRKYEKIAEQYRKEIEKYYLKQVNSTKEGVSTQTDTMEARLSVAEFDDSVFSVVSNIEQYFKQLTEETGIDLRLYEKGGVDDIGIDYKRLQPLLATNINEISPKELIATNADLQRAQRTMKSSLYSAQAARERFVVEITSENHFVTTGDIEGNDYGDTDQSYIRLNVEIDLFNHGTQADKESAIKMYQAERLRFDQQYKQSMDAFRTALTNYNQQKTKRQKTADQVDILAQLIENQKEEIFTDQITYKDIVDSIAKLNRANQTLLEIDLNLYDTLYEIGKLKSEKIL